MILLYSYHNPSRDTELTLPLHKQLFQTSSSPPSPSPSQSMSLPRLPWGNNQGSIRNAFVSPHHHSYQLLLCMLPFFPLWWMKCPYSYQRMSLHCTPGPTSWLPRCNDPGYSWLLSSSWNIFLFDSMTPHGPIFLPCHSLPFSVSIDDF